MKMQASSDSFLFEQFRLDRFGGGLFRRDQEGVFVPVAIGSRALDILAALVERRGDIVSKEEVIAAAWPKTVVEENNLFVQISALRRVLDSEQSGQSCIQTVIGRGYRFIAPVTRCTVGMDQHPRDLLRTGGQPSVALADERSLVPQPISSAERRQLTVMICDLVGAASLAGRLDPEDLREMIATHHRVTSEIAAGFNGLIGKYMSDGAMVYFGYPRAHEDDAERAVRAGLGVIDAIDRLDVGAGKLQARVGIATGLVVVGDPIGEGPVREQSVFGEAPHLAAGLHALAEPDTVVIAAGTRRLVGALFEYRDLGAVEVKGIIGPVPAWQVLRPSIDSRIAGARRAVGDSGAAQTLIRTFARKGVRFVGEVREEGRPAALAREMTAEPGQPGLALPDKPSIAVLPFTNLSGDPEQEYFADGMVEEIITALSRIRWLFVIARNSTFTYKGQAIDVKQVGRELGVRYVLEGSVRKAGGRVRIAGQLIDAETGAHLWADRFDGSLEDVFDLQDKVASSVAGIIEPALQAAETARSARRPTSDLSAYDLCLRARAMYLTYDLRRTLALLEEAIARDPHYGPALGLAAQCCQHLATNFNAPDRDAIRPKGIGFARRAIEVAEDDPGVLANAAMALAVLGEDLDAMIALVDRALAFNPSYAGGWHISGFLRLWAGQTDLAIEHGEMALRFSPRARANEEAFLIGTALFFGRRFAEAVPRLWVAIEAAPAFPNPYRYLAACYAHMGLLGEARAMIARLRAIMPEVRVDLPLPYRNPQHRELFLSGLRLALGETI
jgi:adenylate cyclase